jgi:hypothetical protein
LKTLNWIFIATDYKTALCQYVAWQRQAVKSVLSLPHEANAANAISI